MVSSVFPLPADGPAAPDDPNPNPRPTPGFIDDWIITTPNPGLHPWLADQGRVPIAGISTRRPTW